MLKKKEKESLAEILGEEYASIWHFLCRFRLNREEQEEIVQETMITVWRKLDELQDISKLDAWARQIARNKVNDYWRVKKREQSRLYYFSDLFAAAQDRQESGRLLMPPSLICQEREGLVYSDVFREIMALGRPANQILLLHDIWEESYQEIAIALSMNPNTVRSIAARSHSKLRKKDNIGITSGKENK